MPRLTGWKQDVQYAFRTMLQSPGFSAVAILTLVLGIGATTAIFSVVHAVLLRSLPYGEPDRLVHLLANDPSDPRSGVSYRSFEFWKAQNRSFENVAVYYRNTGWSRVTIAGSVEPESVQAGFTSASFFPVLGMQPALGRVFNEDEEKHGESVVVLSQTLWKRRFGEEANAIGKTLEVDGRVFTVIGVMPPEFQFPARETQLWLPITTNRLWLERPQKDGVHSRGFYMRWNVVARLRSGVALESARAELARLANDLSGEDRDWNMGLPVKVLPLSVEVSGNAKLSLLVLLAAVALVLLISCSNVANLMLARGAARAREFAIRTALGAMRGRLVRQVLTEALILVSIAAGLAVILAVALTNFLVRMGPQDLPRLEEARLDGWVLSFTLAISMAAAVLFGLLPALRAGRTDPNEGLKAHGSSWIGGPGRTRAGSVLVVLEFAISLVLLAGSGLLIRSLWEIGKVDLGFRSDHVVTMRVRNSDGMAKSRQDVIADELLDRLRGISGIQVVGGINGLFELGHPPINSLRVVEGRTEERDKSKPLTWATVSGDYFQAMGIPLLAGRYFSNRDGAYSPLVAIIDESTARRYWPSENPIGKRFKGQDKRRPNDEWLTVIGVVRNTRRQGLEMEPTPHVFEWHKQAGPTIDWVARTSGPPVAIATAMRAAVHEVNPRMVVTNLMTMNQQIDLQMTARRFQTWLLSLFAVAALLLSAVGIYGVVSHSTARRTHEIGIRMALGATRATVLGMILRQGLSFVFLGLVIGFAAAFAMTRILSLLLYGVTPTDPLTFALIGTLLTGVAVVAALIPGWRAARLDPLAALRTE